MFLSGFHARCGGKSVGLFTSPHLIRINERYIINGQNISDEAFLSAFEKVMEMVRRFVREGGDHPSYFELLFLMGMVIFDEADVEYIVLETGLGGRLDATNVVPHPLACIITSISRDHTEYLGETIPEIAGEKAGIIKPGVPVIYDGHCREASEVIRSRAEELGARATSCFDPMYRRETVSQEGITFTFDCQGAEPVTSGDPVYRGLSDDECKSCLFYDAVSERNTRDFGGRFDPGDCQSPLALPDGNGAAGRYY